jgi:hypothetical protein
MGFYFQKPIGLGPLALNFSKSGIGISATKHHHASEPPAHAAAFAIGFLLPFVVLMALVLAAISR